MGLQLVAKNLIFLYNIVLYTIYKYIIKNYLKFNYLIIIGYQFPLKYYKNLILVLKKNWNLIIGL